MSNENDSKQLIINNEKEKEKIKGKQKKEDVHFSFKYDDDEDSTQKYISLKKKQKISSEYQDIDFLYQSQYRFVLNPFSNASITNSPVFEFKDLCLVKYYCHESYSCPICLNSELIVPVITRCGHIFCWPCVVTYYNFHVEFLSDKKKSRFPNCPLCKEKLNFFNDQIKFCEIIKSKPYSSEILKSNVESEKKLFNEFEKYEKEDYKELTGTTEDGILIEENNFKDNNIDETNLKSINEMTSKKHKQSNITNESSNTKNSRKKSEIEKERKYSNYLKSVPNCNFITFNLAFRYNLVIYNVNKDANLNKFLKYNQTNIISDINFPQGSFSSIFKISKENLIQFYLKQKSILQNNLDLELKEGDFTDEKKVASFLKCISELEETTSKIVNLEEGQQKKKESDFFQLNKTISLGSQSERTQSKEFDLKKLKYFYQEKNGDIYFLHPLNYMILITEYKSVNYLPTEIKGHILEIEKYVMTPHLKNKWVFLAHLKLGAQFYLVEINLEKYISHSTYEQFQDIIQEREYNREQVKQEEDYYHQTVQKQESIHNNSLTRLYQNLKFETEYKNPNEEEEKIEVEEVVENVENNQVEEVEKEKTKEKLYYLINGGSLEIIEKEKKEKEKKEKMKKFVFNEDDCPDLMNDLNSGLVDNNEATVENMLQNKNFKKYGDYSVNLKDNSSNSNKNFQQATSQSQVGGGGKKKKKKFVDLEIK